MVLSYDPAGNRIQVTNAVGTPKQNSVTYNYDRLGRMLTQNDPDHGMYTYTYDALGQKLSEVSPKMAAAGQSVTYQYDLLGRMTSRTKPEGTTTWTFDNTTSGNLGVGQLHSESRHGLQPHLRLWPGELWPPDRDQHGDRRRHLQHRHELQQQRPARHRDLPVQRQLPRGIPGPVHLQRPGLPGAGAGPGRRYSVLPVAGHGYRHQAAPPASGWGMAASPARCTRPLPAG